MATNDRIILDEVLKQRQIEIAPLLSASAFFELFTAEQVLKDFDLSYDEIESGLVGDGGDGGIDGIYLFVNGEIVQEDPDVSHLKKNINLEIEILQCKTSGGFQETPIERFITVSDDIFDLSRTVGELAGVYNGPLVSVIGLFRTLHNQLATKFPTIVVNYYYACKGSAPDDNTRRKVEKLAAVLAKHFPSAKFNFGFLGAAELLALARKAPKTTFSLNVAESLSSEGHVGFVCLARLRDLFDFVADEQGQLRRQIFEANVRDYQGRTEVNDEIQHSLQETGNPEDFWWLNNGITVLASKASLSGKSLTIEDPQIVNGLQTSTELYNFCRQFDTASDTRKVLVRVIAPTDPASRDRIIKATNSQTAVQQASLRATDKIHRDIEEYLRPRGLYYDRRKNFHKNEGKPRDRVIGIPFLAQSVMSIVLQRPDTARARPSSLLKKDEDYGRVYNPNHPIRLFYVCAEAMRRVEEHLKSISSVASKDRNNLRFYVAMDAVATLSKTASPSVSDIATLEIS